MNRNKLTPCRKVGLSRKKNTPLKTVEGLLNENCEVNKEQFTPKLITKTKSHKLVSNTDVNNDTPCRQVGLSRKRKISTPLNNFQKEAKNEVVENEIESNLELSLTQSLDKTKNCRNGTSKSYKSNDANISCAKKLSNLFPTSSNSKNKYDKTSQVQEISCTVKNKKTLIVQDEIIANKSIEEIKTKERLNNCSQLSSKSEDVRNVENLVGNDQVNSNQADTCDSNETIQLTVKESESMTFRSNTNIISQNDNQFIKVCYSADKENEKIVNTDLNPKQLEVSKISFKGEKLKYTSIGKNKPKIFKLMEDDDDFEIEPKKKKSKLERSKTEVSKNEKTSKKDKFKKSLSVGDAKLRTRTDSPITSNLSSIDSLTDCFVKLEKIKEFTDKSISLTPKDLSDDDFEFLTCTPKETKMKNLDCLQREVEEKRQILEELKRAKLYKKMHSAEDLKQLTERWKYACIEALQDLLKQLNMHSYMSMEMLLKKLNIPDNFIPLSQ